MGKEPQSPQCGMELRRAVPEDGREIQELIGKSAFNADGSGSLLSLSLVKITAVIETQSFFVARSDNQLIGCSSVVEYQGIAELRSLVVVPNFRGRGVAKSLVGLCIQLAATRKYSQIHALVGEPALELFYGLGFRKSAIPPPKLVRDSQKCPLNNNGLCNESALVLKVDSAQVTRVAPLEKLSMGPLDRLRK